METLFTLTILTIAIVAGCTFGIFGFIIVFMIGVLMQSGQKSSTQKEILEELKQLKEEKRKAS